MKRFTFAWLLLLYVSFSCTTPPPDQSDAAAASRDTEATVSETERAINEAVKAVYAAISFEEGAVPDYKALNALFTPEATFYNFRYDTLGFVILDQFIAGYKAAVDNEAITSFSEVELGGETEYFGRVGHRISAYASYLNGSDEIGERGVNSFQLLEINGKWIVNSVIWDIEKEGQPIPDRFLREN